MSSILTFESHESSQSRVQQMTTTEQTAFDNFTEQVKKLQPTSTPEVKSLLRAFAIAKRDPEEALKVWKAFQEVWNEANAAGTMEEVLEELETGKWALGGFDSEGRRIIHFFAQYHNPKQFSMYLSFKTNMIISDLLLDNAATQEKGAIFVVYLEGTGWANFDMEAQKYFSSKTTLMGQAAADMIYRCVLVDAPWYVRFKKLW